MDQNYPNPFNPETNITLGLVENGHVTLSVYNMRGQEIKTLLNGDKPAGIHNIVFNAENLPSGIYLYRMQTRNYTQIKKMILLQ